MSHGRTQMKRTHIDDRGAILVEEKSPLRASHVLELIEFQLVSSAQLFGINFADFIHVPIDTRIRVVITKKGANL